MGKMDLKIMSSCRTKQLNVLYDKCSGENAWV